MRDNSGVRFVRGVFSALLLMGCLSIVAAAVYEVVKHIR